MDIRELAQREHQAEEQRSSAEKEWREAWWATTYALAEPEDKTEAGNALTVASEVLGQSRGWLAKRRRTGKAFASLAVSDVEPRKAIECAAKGLVVDEDLIADLRQSEADGESLREFFTRITGQQWSTGSVTDVAADLTGSETKVEEFVSSLNHEQVARFQHALDDRRRQANKDQEAGLEDLLELGALSTTMQRVTARMVESIALLEDDEELDPDWQSAALGYIDEAIGRLTSLRGVISGEVSVKWDDSGLEAILGGGDQ